MDHSLIAGYVATMPNVFAIHLHFPSRWGSGSHLDVEFSELGVIIRTGPKRVLHVAGKEGWTGHRSGDHTLRGLFEDEGIKGGKVVEATVERIWTAWLNDRDGSANSRAASALEEFRVWVASGAKPNAMREG